MATGMSDLAAVRQDADDEISAYERLISDAMYGDPLLFARADAVEAAWAIADPFVKANSAVFEYEPGTWGPPEADKLAAGVGGWENPR